MITRIGHIALNPKDMDKSIEFYCTVLGFQKAFELNDDEGKPWIVYLKISEGQFLELFYGAKGDNPVAVEEWHLCGFQHLCLETDNLYEDIERIRALGIQIDQEPKTGADHNIQAWIHDPDGNKVELMQLSPDSPQAKAGQFE